MRSLRLIGLHEDGSSIVCEDPARRERFLLPADERLRAAVRGDITRLGQIEIELESQMRPREIQARIRSGESVDQVAHAAGVPVQRVERFAYPVLLERSRTAELAQQAHPVRDDGPDVQTLAEVVSYAFGVRGQDYTQATWDAWRGEDNKWVVALDWTAGRSPNRAKWKFAPGAHGGTVTAIDEHAMALLNPNSYQAPRAVEPTLLPVLRPEEVPDPPRDQRGGLINPPDREPEEDDTTEIPVVPAVPDTPSESTRPKPASARTKQPASRQKQQRENRVPALARPLSGGALSGRSGMTGGSKATEAQQDSANVGGATGGESATKAVGQTRSPGRKPTKKERATIPAWEDVLLGVRSR